MAFSAIFKICLLALWLVPTCSGESYQFFLEIYDMLDPEWIYRQWSEIGTKIKCASLCFRDEPNCAYFGYRNKSCYLLTETVNKDNCSLDDCSDDGMKIYKWLKPPPVTTLPPTTSTTPVPTTTTTPAPTTTTTEVTTTTKEPTTTTTEATTTTTTAEPTTTTTTEPTTTEPTTTTTTTEPPTTTTTTTTTEPPTTTTTEQTTTTTEMTTTTTQQTTTITEPPYTTPSEYACSITDGGAEGEVVCPLTTTLLRGMGTRTPFFSDGVGPTCANIGDEVYDQTEEVIRYFYPRDLISWYIAAICPHENHVITKFKLCVKDAHVHAMGIHCRMVLEPERIIDIFNATSDDEHVKVLCGEPIEEDTGIKAIYFMDSGNGIVTRIVFTCVRIEKKNNTPLDQPPPDTEAGAPAGGPG